MRKSSRGNPYHDERGRFASKNTSKIVVYNDAAYFDKRTEERLLADILAKEPKITKEVQGIITNNKGTLRGFEKRIKSVESIRRKITDKKTSINKMKDIIRYTAIYEPEELSKRTNACIQDFKSKGYLIIKIKNSWEDENAPYKGVNIQLKTPEGQLFELQVHTNESFELKNGELHTLYEEYRMIKKDSCRKAELRNQMIELSAKLTSPKNISEVK